MLANLIGWIPAIILPSAASFQLYKIVRLRSAKGVSITTWLLFGLANFASYIFTEKYFLLQSVLAFLVTAVLDFFIVALVLYYKK